MAVIFEDIPARRRAPETSGRRGPQPAHTSTVELPCLRWFSLIASLTGCGVALSGAAPAHASPTQIALFQDDRQLVAAGDLVRERRLDEIEALGADAVKLQLLWAAVAPPGRTRPRGFDAGDHLAYPAERWQRYDALIRSLAARGLRPLVALSPPAPGWATARAGDPQGVERPDPREFGRFVRAAGTRYDGSHSDAAGVPLPRVDFWSIWNEPNHPQFLLPLGSRGGVPLAPHAYRGLVTAAVGSLRATGHGPDTILFGEILPIGRGAIGPRYTIKPLVFLRELFCLDARSRPFRGAAARARGCQRFRRVSGVGGLAYHPYTRPEGPRAAEPTQDDATIRSLDRVARTLDRAAALGRLDRRGLPIYNTEFGYQSRPPDPFQTRVGRIPAFLNEAEWISYRNRRVASWSQYGLLDDPLLAQARGAERFGLFQAGLRYGDGREKRGVYDAYRLPIFARLRGTREVDIWGAARPGRSGDLWIEQRRAGGRFLEAPGGRVSARNGQGYFRRRLRLGQAATRSFRLRYSDAGKTSYSRTATPVAEGGS